MKNNILGIIPARYDSQRLHGKVLIDIGGQSMLQRVYNQACRATRLDKVLVATDHEGVFEHVKSFGGEAIMTSPAHNSGTDRCAEVARQWGESYPVVINIQGDEPFINPQQIDQVAALFDQADTQIATLAKKIETLEELQEEKEAKIVLNHQQEVLYMSRSPIPYLRKAPRADWLQHHTFYKHIGIYGFRAEVLAAIPHLPPSALEAAEGLEQLRWLGHYRLKVGFTEFETFAIDTEADLAQVDKYLPKP
ncbi:MAG: 3-deoxy-manno-octulosonate cytidylyltransferase [Microscillaceae bacterium]|nr:3-deoxy-manno-octulosonate cytidylyltransferase [Microscillaceae bacterium]